MTEIGGESLAQNVQQRLQLVRCVAIPGGVAEQTLCPGCLGQGVSFI